MCSKETSLHSLLGVEAEALLTKSILAAYLHALSLIHKVRITHNNEWNYSSK